MWGKHGLSMFFGLLLAVLSSPAVWAAASDARQHLVFWKGTPQEIDVYRIRGRQEGPTAMIMGGLQGDEPGGFLSADLYADLSVKRGNLIVVPRANFRSVVQQRREVHGDMNRKFENDAPGDPESNVIAVIKSLMAESDVFLNLHDGSGFYRPTWESDLANPKRYGQSIIADSDTYRTRDGRVLELERCALQVIERVNREIDDPLHKFHFFNMRTTRTDSSFPEQRKSASYFALTQLGIPAFAIETSKHLPSLDMKIRQHNLAVNAFLDLFGVEVEQPGVALETPALGYLVVEVNNRLPLAVADGQTLLLAPGDTIEVVHVGANYERGVSVDIEGMGGFNDLHRPVAIDRPVAVVVRKDNTVMGRIALGLLPEGEGQPRLEGGSRIRPPRPATLATLDMLPGRRVLNSRTASGVETARTDPPRTAGGKVTGFLLEVDGRPVRVAPGDEAVITAGSLVKIVDLESDGALPRGTVMNLRGFVPRGKAADNDGEDRGTTADTGEDMQPDFSRNGKGERYSVNAERGRTVLASCTLRIVRPKLAAVTVRMQGVTKILSVGSRTGIPAGVPVEVLGVALKDGAVLGRPRYTLGGREFPSALPQTLRMRDIAVNLAVFNGTALAGKVTWVP